MPLTVQLQGRGGGAGQKAQGPTIDPHKTQAVALAGIHAKGIRSLRELDDRGGVVFPQALHPGQAFAESLRSEVLLYLLGHGPRHLGVIEVKGMVHVFLPQDLGEGRG